MIAWLLGRLGHYVSTYCLHGNCEACRLTCKTCAARCRHRCHRGVT